ncbi:WD40-repeat-containing domain protein [Trichoderma velutinum]
MDVPWIISGSEDGAIKIWDRTTNECIATLTGHSGAIKRFAWSPILQSLASASDDGTVKVWNVATGECILTFSDHAGGANAVAWSPDGKQLSSSDDNTIKIWNPTTKQCVLTLEGHGGCINSIAWSSDGTKLVSASADKTLKIWSLATGQCISTFEGHSDEVVSVAWSPDTVHIASGSNDNSIKVWDETTGACTLTLNGHNSAVRSIAWSPNTLRLASASLDNTIKIWDTSSGQCTITLEGHEHSVTEVSWSPDAAWLISASDDRTIKTWDPATGQCLSTLTGHESPAKTVLAVPKVGKLPLGQLVSLLPSKGEKDDATVIASGSQDRTVKLWDPETGLCIKTLEGHTGEIWSVAWAPDQKHVASASDDSSVKIWDSTNGLCKFTLQHERPVHCISWSPDGTKLASSLPDGVVWVWDITWDTDIAPQASIINTTGHDTTILTWSPDGTRLLLASADSRLSIWYLAAGESSAIDLDADRRVDAIGWSPDSKLFASGGNDNEVTIWDADTRESKLILRGHRGAILGLSWSPGGTKIVTGSEDRTIKMWDSISGNCLSTFEGHAKFVQSVSWSADGKEFASGSRDCKVKLWNEAKIWTVAWSSHIKPPSPPQPPGPDPDSGLARWMQVFMALQARLRDLESKIDGVVDQSVKAALESIAKGLAKFNELIDLWPDYTGDDVTNEKRMSIIQIATDLIQTGAGFVTGSGTDGGVIPQLNDIEKELKEKKTQFYNETDEEQVELTSLEADIQTAINKMNTDQKAYEEAQALLLAKIEQISLEAAMQRQVSLKKKTVLDGVNYTSLLEQNGSLDDLQQDGELAYLILDRAQNKVRNLEFQVQALKRIQKNRPLVQRAIGRAERLIQILRMMTQGLTNEGGAILAVVNLIMPTIEKLSKVGEPPYQRQHRSSEDDLCTYILMIHRESLIDEAFAESARKAVAQVQDWFDDDIPKKTQAEIDVLVKNPFEGVALDHSQSSDLESEREDASQKLPATVAVPSLPFHWNTRCALVVDDELLGGRDLGLPTDIRCLLMARHVSGTPWWLEFVIEIPRGSKREENGSRAFYFVDPRQNQRPIPSLRYRLEVKFNLVGLAYAIKPIEPALVKLLPKRRNKLSVFEIDVEDNPGRLVCGFGMPFDNRGHPSDGWINYSQPIIGNHTLLDILSKRTFRFVVESSVEDMQASFVPKRIPPPFRYPYGTDHSWNPDRYDTMLHQTKGKTFLKAWKFENHNDHLAVVTQSQVQDFVWLRDAAVGISRNNLRACFVSASGSSPSLTDDDFYVIVPLTQWFLKEYGAALRCLLNSEVLVLYILDPAFRDQVNYLKPARWPARVAHSSTMINALAHQGFQLRDWVEAVLQFHPNANPTTREPGGLQLFRAISSNTKFKMNLHRDLVLGNGFFNTLQSDAEIQPPMQFAHAHSLPTVNLLPESQPTINALMEDVVHSDREKLRAYLSRVPLGFGLVTGDPGSGKTTVLSVATIGMSIALGPIYASAATDIAADNFAKRLNRVSKKFTRRLKRVKELDDNPAKSILVVRGYYEDDEVAAFHNLLEHPQMGDKAAPPYNLVSKSKWRLHLSLAFWLLMALRSPAVRPLQIDGESDFQRLRDVATGVNTYKEYKKGHTVGHTFIKRMFLRILSHTDVLCTEVSLCCQDPYDRWKKTAARGISVDEANNLGRPDLYSVWGNTLLPCLLCGDDKQLEPRVVSFGQKDSKGNSMNRLEDDGKYSALLFFKGNGWPVFRLQTQLRMATGLFDLCHGVVKCMTPLNYGPDCNIRLDRHACGRELEAFLQKRFPELAPPPDGKLAEAFINCAGSGFYVNEVTRSGWNPIQSRRALGFICDLVTQTKITPADVFIITPYEANVEYIESERKMPEYSAISSMAPAATVDDFQGRQGNIVVLVMATTTSEPGYTSDIHYLCVMLSRHISGLVIFGDDSIPWTSDANDIQRCEFETDEKAMNLTGGKDDHGVRKEYGLKNMLDILKQKKRIATLPVPELLNNITSDVS